MKLGQNDKLKSRLCGLNISLFGVKLWIFYYQHIFGPGSNFLLQSLGNFWKCKFSRADFFIVRKC